MMNALMSVAHLSILLLKCLTRVISGDSFDWCMHIDVSIRYAYAYIRMKIRARAMRCQGKESAKLGRAYRG